MTTKTDHEMAQLMYGGTVHRDNELNNPNADLLQPLERVNAANDAFRDGLRAVEVSDAEGQQIAQLLQRYSATPPTAAEKAEWLRESSAALARVHGPEHGRERAALARQFVERNPTLAKTLGAVGISGHPRLVEIIASRAWSARAQGRL